jgi:hypothetical protein
MSVSNCRIEFEPMSKVLATAVVALPMVLLSALIIFVVEVGLCIGVLLLLYFVGLVHPGDIPNRYVILSLSGLVLLAVGYSGFAALRNFSRMKD